MKSDPTSIVLITQDTKKTAELSQMLKANAAYKFSECKSTLSEMNGRATKLAAAHDLVIFQTETATDNDIAAIEALRKSNSDDAVILALSDGNMTLADVQRLTRSGVNDVVADTISPDELTQKIEQWSRPSIGAAESDAGTPGPGGKVITVAQARGGIGATMLAVNLADQLLGKTGWMKKSNTQTVALVDLDLQFGAVSGFLDIRRNEALFQMAMEGIEPDATFVAQSIEKMPSGLSVLAGPSQIAPLDSLKNKQVEKLLHTFRREYDFVVLNLPRALVEWIAPVLESSDLMLLVTDSSVPAIHQARRLIDFYTEDNLTLPIEIVVNHEAKPLVKGRHHSEAAKVLERPLQHWVPFHRKAAKEAVDRGVPLSQVSRNSPLTKSIARLARTVTTGLADGHAAAKQ
ncbi:AAA family ATPase [Roseovarius aestuarii]|uniref:CobQ/CobB/MinD/ParA nucleotide binding domain protein n=1 Tax=Roseovarius aestuarii TaxID=475083 RepID=A0A1X7BY61_9RHOB|nr:AAA family ATPase [Roseovarius aestuarii]SMC14465.1 CobQ/CobB/MinD/ParA nucleotide binding domain protein [Roseovarius aestuarii]